MNTFSILYKSIVKCSVKLKRYVNTFDNWTSFLTMLVKYHSKLSQLTAIHRFEFQKHVLKCIHVKC